ncbi:DNA cytosine methyltransferase [Sphingomonas sp. SFZ2018-12]|uniref:DNA cytosine methyltransferase n=1 Tax=Sphingomonas sp. SFZ2018-12 TaxID=2683197 RepID=UPI001F0F08B7|nr:DNA cytosine methyltransferase [Sphingomonas sp. SFZ2018-12]
MRPLFIDGFAGGGGASTGIAQALGRDVDIAINHSPSAIAIHKANHPTTRHFCQDIRAVWPAAATKLQPVAGAWFSPDCKEYSKAKGGPVKDRHIRALADEVTVWLRETRPTVAYLENVEEFEYAAPLDEHGIPIKGLEGRAFKRLIRTWRGLSYRVQWRKLKACDYGAPTSRKRLYIIMRCDGLPIVWPKPTHGAPDNPDVISGKLQPYRTAAECIDWSIPCPSIFGRKRELAESTKRRIAHGVMRYVVNAAKPFIVGTAFTNTRASRTFDPADPLRTVTTQPEYGAVDVELAPHLMTNRNSQKPFNGADEPTHTITAGGAHLNMVGASLVKMGNGERDGQAPRALDPSKPLGTVTAKGSQGAVATAALAPFVTFGQQGGRNRPIDQPHHTIAASEKDTNGIVTAFLSSFYTSNTNGGRGKPDMPLKTTLAGANHHAVITAHIEQANGGPRNKRLAGRPATVPLSTATATGSQQRIVQTTLIEEGDLPPELLESAVQVAAFLVKYYATDGENEVAQLQPVDRPLDTITVKARFAVVTVTIDAKTYVIVDIGLRMLKPRELARAQGFPDDYILDPVVPKMKRGKLVHEPLTIAEQISAIGNSVCPPVARALVAANQPELQEMRIAA